MESYNALCSLILLCLIGASDGKFFALPSSWKVINNSSLPSYNTVQGGFRAVTDGNGNAIVSKNNRTGLGFINLNNSGEFVLSIVLGLDLTTLSAVEIWTANRNRKVAEGAMLKLGTNGDLVLEDSDGTVAWNINTGKPNPKGILMTESGNLQIYNTTNESSLASAGSNLVWQSWDYPTDTLVPGQVLKRGQELVSNSSATNTSDGSYKLVMEPGGLVLYYTTSSVGQEPYWSMGLKGLDYQGILRPCFYDSSSTLGSEAVYTGQNLQVSFNGTIGNSSSSCANGTQILFMAPFNNETDHRFLRLERDGSLRVYRVNPFPGETDVKDWTSDYELDPSNMNCILPRACGPYGICNNGQCTCPGSGTVDGFQQIQSLDVTQGCYSTQGKPTCSQASAAPQHLMDLDGVDYYPNNFLKPEANVSTVEKCRNLCTSNCSCSAAFFRNTSASCYLAYGPLSSLKLAANQTYKAYIKVLNRLPPNRTSGPSNSLSIASIAGIALSSAAAALFLCLITIIFVRRGRKDQVAVIDEEEIDPEEMEEEAFLKTLPGLPPRFTYHELKEATDNFSRKLGTGGFGSVYEGVLKDKTSVAIKKLDGPRQGYKEFRAEVATIGSISHMNLVRLRGFCADSRQRLLVYELMENNSLDKWLFSRPDNNMGCLTWEQRYNVAVGTARGLAYLHEQCREPIMHLDIKPQNILLDKNFNPKVSDFGMSKLLNDDMTQVMTAVRGTPGYLAPEWLRYSIATKKCDVYSFGMVLLELVSGRRNFDPSAADPRLCYFPAWAMLRALEGRYMDLVDKRLGDNSVNREGVTRMTKVAFWCIQDNPNQRPWMSVALKMLEGEWDIPDAPMWLLQKGGPQFLEGYGYDPMEEEDDGKRDESSLIGNSVGAGGSFESVTIPSTQLAAAR